MLIFLFLTGSMLFLQICSKNQNCLLKSKLRIQINLNMQNSMVIFIFLVRKYSFCVNLIQKLKRVSLRRNLVPKYTNSNMQNFIVMFTFSILDFLCKFCTKSNMAFLCCLIYLPVVQSQRLEASGFPCFSLKLLFNLLTRRSKLHFHRESNIKAFCDDIFKELYLSSYVLHFS